MEDQEESETLIFGGLGRIVVGIAKLDAREGLAWIESLVLVMIGLEERLNQIAQEEAEG